MRIVRRIPAVWLPLVMASISFAARDGSNFRTAPAAELKKVSV